MKYSINVPSELFLRRAVVVAACTAIAKAIATILGWILDIPMLRSIYPQFGTMRFTSAIGILVGGIGILLLRDVKASTLQRRVGQTLATIMMFMGVSALIEYFLGSSQGFSDIVLQKLVTGHTEDFGRMSAITSLSLVLTGTALWGIGTKTGQILIVGTILLAFSAASGYIFDGYLIVIIPTSPPMAGSTALTLLLLSAGILLARPNVGVMRVIISDLPGGRSFRFMLPAVLFMPILLEWLEERSGLFDEHSGAVMIATVLTAGYGTLLYINARSLNHSAELRTSEGRVKGILNAAMDGVISINESYRIIFVNPAAERIFGYSAADLLEKPIGILLPLDKREAHEQHIKHFGTTGVTTRTMYALGEIRGLHADGREIPIEATISQTIIDEEKIFTVILRDISERKQSENALRRLADIVDSSADAIIGKTLEGIIISWNRGAEKIYGYSAEEVIGRSISILIPPDKPDELQGILAKVRRSESITYYQTERLHRNGSRLIISLTISPVIDSHGNIVGASTIARDMTQYVRSEENLRVSEERYRSLFENMVEGYSLCRMLYKDGRPHDFVYEAVNPAFEVLTGLKDVIGKNVSKIIPDIHETNPELLEIYGRVAANGIPERFETYVLRLDIWLSISVFCPQSEYFVAVFDNVTERKKAEEALKISESRNRAIVNAVPDLLLQVTDEGVILDYRIPDESALYLPPGEFLERNIHDIFPEDIVALAMQSIEEAIKTNTVQMFTYELSMQGELRYYESRTVHLEGQKSLLVIRDITNRKIAEQAQAESEKRYRTLFENMVEGYAYCQIVYENEQATDYILVAVNDSFEKLTGLKFAVGRPISEMIPGIHITNPEILETYARVAAGGNSEHFETYVPGLNIWFSVSVFSPAAGYFVAVFDNITERKEAEERLRKFSEQLYSLVREAPMGIAMFDRNMRYLAVSRRWVEEFGRGYAELIGMSHYEVNPDISEAWKEAHRRSMAGESLRNDNDSWVQGDGTRNWLRWAIAPWHNTAGAIGGIIISAEDITQRKQAELELDKVHTQLSELYENLPEAIFSVDVVQNKMLQASPAHDTVFGYPPEEFYKNPRLWYEMVLEEDRHVISRGYEILAAGEVLQQEFRILHPNGSVRWIESKIRPTLNENGACVRIDGIAHDVTERKQAQEALRQSEEQFRQLTENIREVFWLTNIEKNEILYISPAYELIWGCSIEELYKSPQNWLAAIHSEDRDRVSDSMLENQIAGKYDVVYRIIRPDGEIRWIHDRAFPIRNTDQQVYRIAGIAEDITRSKQADEKLRQSEEQFRLITENTVDLISILDDKGNRLYLSPSYQRIFSDTHKLLNTTFFDSTTHPDDADKVRENFDQIITTGVNKLWEYRLMTPDGKTHYMETSGSPIRNADGNIKQIVMVTRDITEQKRIEQQIQRSQRLESMGTLAGGIAHDLNNILTPILMSVQVLKKSYTDERSIRLLGMLESSAMRGASIIKQVLTFSRGAEGERSLVQVRHILDEISKIIHETFLKSITLRLSIEKDLPTIMADPTQIHQILMNLCVNARDAMPHGGILEITAEAVTLDTQYARMQLDVKEGDYVVITVTDQGTGIPPAVLDKMFEPFFTTKEVGKGTGLGLSTVMAITKSHNGFINVYSEVGNGTTFKIYLPAVLNAEKSEQQNEQTTYLGNGEQILVVDDEPNILEITKQTLERKGYRVITATDGTEAVAIYAANREEIDLVITDMVMPYMDGATTIRALQKMNPNVKIIAVSGLKQNDSHLAQQGVIFLSKPYTSDRLMATIHDVLLSVSSTN